MTRKGDRFAKTTKRRILVVDDHPLLRHSIRSFLENEGDLRSREGENGTTQ